MKFNQLALSALLVCGFSVQAAPAEHAKSLVDTTTTKEVGGAPMYSNKNIIDNAVNSKDHTILVQAVIKANLVDTLKGAGPFTVFAPDNAAFNKIAPDTLKTVLDTPPLLAKVLTYHVVAQKLDSKAIAALIKKGKGSTKLKTVAGGMLTAKMDGSVLVLTDEKGGTSRATIVDVYQSNGVIHSIDTVLMPK